MNPDDTFWLGYLAGFLSFVATYLVIRAICDVANRFWP